MSFKQSNETNHVNTISFSTLDYDLLWDLATQVMASSIIYIQGNYLYAWAILKGPNGAQATVEK